MWQRAAGGARAAVDTVIGPGCVVHGRLEGHGIIRIEGRLEGEIDTEGDVIVGEAGELLANVSARDLLLGGRLQGDVRTVGKLEILSTGRLEGDISARQLIIAEGAVFSGKCETFEVYGSDTRPVVPQVVVAEAGQPRGSAVSVRAAREAQVLDGQRAEELRTRLRAVSVTAGHRAE
ncbi:MAG TPA: polymer-forming cytoskeletal protein [Bacillota bacterium]|nr:polymer-forming cytoskeletal protein [Bacillota bacterium]